MSSITFPVTAPSPVRNPARLGAHRTAPAGGVGVGMTSTPPAASTRRGAAGLRGLALSARGRALAAALTLVAAVSVIGLPSYPPLG
jgi:hypothetical protein